MMLKVNRLLKTFDFRNPRLLHSVNKSLAHGKANG